MTKIETGTIFKFAIPYGLGVGYAKVIDFSHLSIYDGITVKVYDYFEDKKLKDAAFFKDMPLFMNPIPIVKMPSIRGKYAWKKIGTLHELNDTLIPVYKKYVHEGFAWETLEAYESKKWYARVNLSQDIGPVSFDKVRHLEELFLRSTTTIERRVAMQLLRYKGVDVKDFLMSNSIDTSWKIDFNTQQWIPLYKTLPEAIRGKPLIKGWVPDEYLDFDWNLNSTNFSIGS